MFHFPGPFHWKIRTARQLEKMGLDESADAIWGITEKSTRERHEKEARKAERRAKPQITVREAAEHPGPLSRSAPFELAGSLRTPTHQPHRSGDSPARVLGSATRSQLAPSMSTQRLLLRQQPAHQRAHERLAVAGRMAAARARPQLNGDPLGAPQLHAKRLRLGAHHVLVQVKGGTAGRAQASRSITEPPTTAPP